MGKGIIQWGWHYTMEEGYYMMGWILYNGDGHYTMGIGSIQWGWALYNGDGHYTMGVVIIQWGRVGICGSNVIDPRAHNIMNLTR